MSAPVSAAELNAKIKAIKGVTVKEKLKQALIIQAGSEGLAYYPGQTSFDSLLEKSIPNVERMCPGLDWDADESTQMLLFYLMGTSTAAILFSRLTPDD